MRDPLDDSARISDSKEKEARTDEDLVRLYQADPGAEEARRAAEELFERYGSKVYLWCVRRVRNHDVAADLAQDVLLSALRALGSFEGRSRYSTWLYAIARHRCYRHLRPASLLRDEDEEIEERPDGREGPDVLLERQEREDAVLKLVQEVLSADEQTAIWLRCFERLSVDEITRRLALTTSAGARGVLQSARRKLRVALEKLDAREGKVRP